MPHINKFPFIFFALLGSKRFDGECVRIYCNLNICSFYNEMLVIRWHIVKRITDDRHTRTRLQILRQFQMRGLVDCEITIDSKAVPMPRNVVMFQHCSTCRHMIIIIHSQTHRHCRCRRRRQWRPQTHFNSVQPIACRLTFFLCVSLFEALFNIVCLLLFLFRGVNEKPHHFNCCSYYDPSLN